MRAERESERRQHRLNRKQQRRQQGTNDGPLAWKDYLRHQRHIERRRRRLQQRLDNLSRRQQDLWDRAMRTKEAASARDRNVSRSQRATGIHETLRSLARDSKRGGDETFGDQRGRRVRRAATAYKSRTWPYGVIPYVIQANFSSMFIYVYCDCVYGHLVGLCDMKEEEEGLTNDAIYREILTLYGCRLSRNSESAPRKGRIRKYMLRFPEFSATLFWKYH